MLKPAILLMLMVVLFGCMTEQKATDYLKKKDKLDDVCAAEFPVKEVFVKGKDSISFDTMFLETLSTDTVKTKDTIFITKTLPQKLVTVTKMRVDTFKQRDFAQENILMDKIRDYQNNEFKQAAKIDTLTQDVSNWKHKAHNYFWIIVLLVVALFRRPLWSLISTIGNPIRSLNIFKK